MNHNVVDFNKEKADVKLPIHSPRPLGRLLAVAGLAVVMAGCASLGMGTPEDIVHKRSNDYWKARMEANYKKAYDMSTPSYRSLKSADQFRLQYGAGAAIKGAETTQVKCQAEKCTARVKISAAPALAAMNLGTIDTYIDEIWLLEDGQWWHYQSP